MPRILQKKSLPIFLLIFLFCTGIVIPVGLASAEGNLQLSIHYIEGVPDADKVAYTNSVYLSVIDGQGNPIRNLESSQFVLSEDSHRVELESLSQAQDLPMNLVLLLDTSGSMAGLNMENARHAATDFVNGLQANDQVALKTFSEDITTIIDFTNQHSDVTQRLSQIASKSGSGTCLYDAAYAAVETSATLPIGQRAVILLTDGVDETQSGSVCSVHTLEDVIALASNGTTRVPIFTLGLGNRVDEQGLRRLSSMTGGNYLYAPDASSLNTMFEKLSEQLQSQYVLLYTSHAGPGPHTLIVSLTHNGEEDQDSRNFLLPGMPTSLTILNLSEGQNVQGRLKISSVVTGQGETIESLVFQVDGEKIGEDEQSPYEIEWDTTTITEGLHTLTVIGMGANQQEIASSEINLHVKQEEVQAVAIQDEESMEPEVYEEEVKTSSPWIINGIILGGFLFLLVGSLGVFFLLRSQKKNAEHKQTDNPVNLGSDHSMGETQDIILGAYPMAQQGLARIIILNSDDPNLLGSVYQVTEEVTRLGRGKDNDLQFINDQTVSRQHALLEKINNEFVLHQVSSLDENGLIKWPSFGTAVNGQELETDKEIYLHNGDEIRLGKRVMLRFEPILVKDLSELATMDEIDSSDFDATEDYLYPLDNDHTEDAIELEEDNDHTEDAIGLEKPQDQQANDPDKTIIDIDTSHLRDS